MLDNLNIVDKIKYIETGKVIPKVIYQTCQDKRNLPIEIINNIRKLKEINSDWKYILYDDIEVEEFISSVYGENILEIYKMVNPDYGAAKADLFRYLLIYAYGGVYLDLKSTVEKPLSESLSGNESFILSHWANSDYGNYIELKDFGCREYIQWCIVSVKGHPFLEKVIKETLVNILQYRIEKDGVGKKAVLLTTGPIAYTMTISKIKNLYNYSEKSFENDLGVKYSIYGDEKSHKKLFHKHYSDLYTPISTRMNAYSKLKIFFLYFIYKVTHLPFSIRNRVLHILGISFCSKL